MMSEKRLRFHGNLVLQLQISKGARSQIVPAVYKIGVRIALQLKLNQFEVAVAPFVGRNSLFNCLTLAEL